MALLASRATCNVFQAANSNGYLGANSYSQIGLQYPGMLPLSGTYILAEFYAGTRRIVGIALSANIFPGTYRQTKVNATPKVSTFRHISKSASPKSGTNRKVSMYMDIEFDGLTNRVIGRTGAFKSGTRRLSAPSMAIRVGMKRKLLNTARTNHPTSRRLSTDLIAYFSGGTKRIVYEVNMQIKSSTVRQISMLSDQKFHANRYVGVSDSFSSVMMRKVLAQPFNNEIHIPLRFSHRLYIKMRYIRFRGE